jgi:PAS domain-containing protein
MNEFQKGLAETTGRTLAERHIEAIRQHGGIFVDAVRLTRMPMIVTDATLPGNPIIFANQAFVELSGYNLEELLGQDPLFSKVSGGADRGGREDVKPGLYKVPSGWGAGLRLARRQ